MSGLVSVRAVTSGPSATQDVARAIASMASPGDLVLLAGDLGAGKTTFAKGFAAAIGVRDPVTSPTFTLMRQHPADGGLTLLHADVYRLDHLQEVVDLGLTELLEERAIALVEWGDLAEPVLPADFLEIRLELGAADDERRLTLRPVGTSWAARRDRLAEALRPWAPAPEASQ